MIPADLEHTKQPYPKEYPMAEISPLFVTRLYRAELAELGKKKVDYAELAAACEAIADDDEARSFAGRGVGPVKIGGDL